MFLSAALAAALVAGTILVTGGVAAAAGPVAQSQGRFLSGTVAGGDLASLVSVAPASASAPPGTTSHNPLGVAALNAVDVNLGGGIKLLGNTPGGILTLGAVNQYATASVDGSSFASSGAVGSNGAIAIGSSGSANTGIAPSNATLNLNPIIAGTPVLQGALSNASVTVGALAATANETAAGVQSGAYKIGSLSLDLVSPTLPPVYTSVSGALATALGAVNLLGLVTGLPTSSSLLEPLTSITSANGSFVVNLQTGVVHVDVAKLLAGQQINGRPGDINNLPPNTSLLPYITAGLTTQLLPAITEAITGPTGLVQTLTTKLGAARLLGLPISPALLNPILTAVTSSLTPVVAGLGTGVVGPVTNGLTALVALTANIEPTLPNTGTTYSKAALSIGVVPTAHTAAVTLASASVGTNAGPAIVPTTTGLTPNSGPIAGGTTVTVTGTGFVPGLTTVNVDGVNQPANATSATSLTFLTPVHPVGAVPVSVSTAGGTSAPAQTFTYLAAPTITVSGLSPASGPVAGNTTVTVTGTGFVPGATTVNVDGTNQSANATSATTLTFVTPAHIAAVVGVTAQTAGGVSSPPRTFTFVAVPTIDPNGLSPNQGPVAGFTTVTVTGTGFVPGATTVNVDGVNQAANATSATSLTFVTRPHAAGPVDVTAQTVGGISNPARTFTYLGAPTASSLTPDNGPVSGNTTVTVTGTGFVPGSTSVTIGGINVPASVASPTSLTFNTPPHAAGLMPVTVTTPGGISDPPLGFTYGRPTLGILRLLPDHGPIAGNTTVTVTGTAFVPAATTVNVDGVNQPATVTSTTTLTFVTTAHVAGPVDVTVQVAGLKSNPITYTFLGVPTVLSLAPDHGPISGGTLVTVTGSGFFPGDTAVNLDRVRVVAVNVLSGTSLTFLTPAHGAGAVGVTVTTVGGTSTPSLPFTYGPPTINPTGGLSPVHGPAAGGTTVTVTGTGFVVGATSVNVDGVNQSATAGSNTSLTFVTPAHPVGPSQVTVTTAGGTSSPYRIYTFDAPTVTSLRPGGGPIAGGTPVTIKGKGFAPGLTTVTFGGATIPASAVTVSLDGTTATLTSPLGTGPGPVVVTLSTPQATATPNLSFVYGPPVAGLLSPNRGPSTGGTVVTVTGAGFVPGATTITIGGNVVAAGAVVVGPDGMHATFTTPAHLPASVGVVVTTAGGTSTPALPFTYVPLAALSLSPDHGPSIGNTAVTIVGTGFVPGRTSVTIGGVTVPAALVTVNPLGTSAAFRTPPHAAGGVLVTATTPGGTTNPLGFLYGAALLPVTSCVLTGVNPVTGLDAATVSVLANVGIKASLVRSNFSIKVGAVTAGSAPVVPLLGGFLSASISVPVAVGTTKVSYVLTPVVAGIYRPVTGGPIQCTSITPTQQVAGTYHPLAPYRVLDTRHGNGASQPIGARGTLTINVRGVGGVPARYQRPGNGVATVMLNVTTTGSAAAGFLTVYPGGIRANTSSINFTAGATIANLVAATVAADGTVSIYNGSAGVTDVVADIQGYFSDGPTVAPGSFVPLRPARILDTFTGTGAPKAPVQSRKSITLKVTGVGGVPSTNVAAVVLNMTVAQATSAGFITVYTSDPKPLVSSLNFYRGETDANLVIIPVAPDGTIKIYNGSLGSVRLMADVSGFFRGGAAILDGEFVPVSPGRILDTRVGNNFNGKVARQSTIAPTILGRNRIPWTGVSAVVSNLTVTSATGPGFITAYPQGALPLASNLNFVAKVDRPNAVIARVGSDGKVRLHNGSLLTSVDLVADVSGYFISKPVRN